MTKIDVRTFTGSSSANSARRAREPAETVEQLIARGRAAGIEPACIERRPAKGPLPKLTRRRRKALRAKLAAQAVRPSR